MPHVDGRNEAAAYRCRPAQCNPARYHRRLPLLVLCRGQIRKRLPCGHCQCQEIHGRRPGRFRCRQLHNGSAGRFCSQGRIQQFIDIHPLRNNVGNQRLGSVNGCSGRYRGIVQMVPAQDTRNLLRILQRVPQHWRRPFIHIRRLHRGCVRMEMGLLRCSLCRHIGGYPDTALASRHT